MNELAKSFAALAEKYGPAVADAAKSAARVEAYSSLMSSLICFGIAATMSWCGWRLRRTSDIDFDPSTAPGLFFGWLLMGLSVIPFCIGIWQWLDPWTWVAINQPELWIAKRAFNI